MLGAGGAIVAVPTLVYIGGISPTLASGYALFVVMVASAIVSVPAWRNKSIHWPAFWAFGITTMITIFSIRHWIFPALPERINVASYVLQTDMLLMLAFAGVLLVAGIGMLRHQPSVQGESSTQPMRLAAMGTVVGVVAGFLGVGGGFLMTPALVMWGRLDMRMAVATSLALICVNSALGVAGDLSRGVVFDWPLVLGFTAFTSVGMIGGRYLHTRIHVDMLRAIFGWLVIAIGLVVLAAELWRS